MVKSTCKKAIMNIESRYSKKSLRGHLSKCMMPNDIHIKQGETKSIAMLAESRMLLEHKWVKILYYLGYLTW